MLEKKISQSILGCELVMFTCRTDEKTGAGDVLFKGSKSCYSVTYLQLAEALDKMNALEEFMSRMMIAAKQRGCCVTSS